MSSVSAITASCGNGAFETSACQDLCSPVLSGFTTGTSADFAACAEATVSHCIDTTLAPGGLPIAIYSSVCSSSIRNIMNNSFRRGYNPSVVDNKMIETCGSDAVSEIISPNDYSLVAGGSSTELGIDAYDWNLIAWDTSIYTLDGTNYLNQYLSRIRGDNVVSDQPGVNIPTTTALKAFFSSIAQSVEESSSPTIVFVKTETSNLFFLQSNVVSARSGARRVYADILQNLLTSDHRGTFVIKRDAVDDKWQSYTVQAGGVITGFQVVSGLVDYVVITTDRTLNIPLNEVWYTDYEDVKSKIVKVRVYIFGTESDDPYIRDRDGILVNYTGVFGSLLDFCACHQKPYVYDEYDSSIRNYIQRSYGASAMSSLPSKWCLFPLCAGSNFPSMNTTIDATGASLQCPSGQCINIVNISVQGTVYGDINVDASCLNSPTDVAAVAERHTENIAIIAAIVVAVIVFVAIIIVAAYFYINASAVPS